MNNVDKTIKLIINKAIDAGIAECKLAYSAPEDRAKLEGAIAGFEICRTIEEPEDLLVLHAQAEQAVLMARKGLDNANANEPVFPVFIGEKNNENNEYWKQRYFQLQIEWISNCASYLLALNGKPPLMPHQPTARAGLLVNSLMAKEVALNLASQLTPESAAKLMGGEIKEPPKGGLAEFVKTFLDSLKPEN